MFHLITALLIAVGGHGHHGPHHHPHPHRYHPVTLVTCTVNRGCTTTVIPPGLQH